ncbi:MAG: hypothetical protein IKB34_00200 [Clostridia bacterium]|nr:hypothetical protein [Clostridia bacterium]
MYRSKREAEGHCSHLTEPVRRRLPSYYRALIGLYADGYMKISSVQLANAMGLAPSQVRTDMLSIGCTGQKGYGYHTADLYKRIGEVLQIHDRFSAVIVGDGELSRHLAECHLFTKRGIKLTGRFSVNDLSDGAMITELEEFCLQSHVDIMVLACDGRIAKKCVELGERAGVRGIMNFSDCDVTSDKLTVRNLHIEDPIMMLCSEMNKDD